MPEKVNKWTDPSFLLQLAAYVVIVALALARNENRVNTVEKGLDETKGDVRKLQEVTASNRLLIETNHTETARQYAEINGKLDLLLHRKPGGE